MWTGSCGEWFLVDIFRSLPFYFRFRDLYRFLKNFSSCELNFSTWGHFRYFRNLLQRKAMEFEIAWEIVSRCSIPCFILSLYFVYWKFFHYTGLFMTTPAKYTLPSKQKAKLMEENAFFCIRAKFLRIRWKTLACIDCHLKKIMGQVLRP